MEIEEDPRPGESTHPSLAGLAACWQLERWPAIKLVSLRESFSLPPLPFLLLLPPFLAGHGNEPYHRESVMGNGDLRQTSQFARPNPSPDLESFFVQALTHLDAINPSFSPDPPPSSTYFRIFARFRSPDITYPTSEGIQDFRATPLRLTSEKHSFNLRAFLPYAGIRTFSNEPRFFMGGKGLQSCDDLSSVIPSYERVAYARIVESFCHETCHEWCFYLH